MKQLFGGPVRDFLKGPFKYLNGSFPKLWQKSSTSEAIGIKQGYTLCFSTALGEDGGSRRLTVVPEHRWNEHVSGGATPFYTRLRIQSDYFELCFKLINHVVRVGFGFANVPSCECSTVQVSFVGSIVWLRFLRLFRSCIVFFAAWWGHSCFGSSGRHQLQCSDKET